MWVELGQSIGPMQLSRQPVERPLGRRELIAFSRRRLRVANQLAAQSDRRLSATCSAAAIGRRSIRCATLESKPEGAARTCEAARLPGLRLSDRRQWRVRRPLSLMGALLALHWRFIGAQLAPNWSPTGATSAATLRGGHVSTSARVRRGLCAADDCR